MKTGDIENTISCLCNYIQDMVKGDIGNENKDLLNFENAMKISENTKALASLLQCRALKNTYVEVTLTQNKV